MQTSDKRPSLPLVPSPRYTVKLPSNEKVTVQYRPFTVREQSFLQLALETSGPDKSKSILEAINQTVDDCTDRKSVDLAWFDSLYLFLEIRAKSVGELLEPTILCRKCEEPIQLQINLEDVSVVKPPGHTKTIKLAPSLGITMRYPNLHELIEHEVQSPDDVQNRLKLIRDCIDEIWTDESVYKRKDYPDDEIQTFVDSMSTTNLQDVTKFFETSPTLFYKLPIDCKKCGDHEDMELTRIADFFV